MPPPGNTVWFYGMRGGREGIRDYTSYIAELVQRYPDRFIGTFTYNPRFGPEKGAQELEFHVKEYGLARVPFLNARSARQVDKSRV